MDNEEIVILHQRVDELDRRVGIAEKEHKEFFDRLRKLENQQGLVELQYEHLDESLRGLKSDLTDIKTDIGEIKEKPAKHWDAVVTAAIGVLVGYLINLAFM